MMPYLVLFLHLTFSTPMHYTRQVLKAKTTSPSGSTPVSRAINSTDYSRNSLQVMNIQFSSIKVRLQAKQ